VLTVTPNVVSLRQAFPASALMPEIVVHNEIKLEAVPTVAAAVESSGTYG